MEFFAIYFARVDRRKLRGIHKKPPGF